MEHTGQKTFAGRFEETQYISSAMDFNTKCLELEKEVLNFIAYKKWGQNAKAFLKRSRAEKKTFEEKEKTAIGKKCGRRQQQRPKQP